MPKIQMQFRPGDLESAEPVIAELLDRYEAWHRARHPETDVVDLADFDLLLGWKINYGNGRLDEWTTSQLEEFLLEWAPRKVSMSEDEAAGMPAAVGDAITFLAEERLLSPKSAPARRLAVHARGLTSRFIAAMRNPSNFGMAKSIFGGLDVGPDAPLTQERLDALVAEFNALPFDERAAITDQAFSGSEPDLPVIGPVRLPTDDVVRASADAAPVLAGFTALAEYFRAPGRPLTARGNIKLADAAALSGILGTETLEEKIGDASFSRQSSARMPQLDHWQWWAREAGALRVRNGRMVGVEAWRRRRTKDPVDEARTAFGVLLAYGPLASYRPGTSWPTTGLVDAMVAPLLALMLAAPGPVEFAELAEAVEAAGEATGRRPTIGDREFLRDDVASTLDLLLTLLERAGVVTQHDPTFEAGRFSERRTGGFVELTPFGVVTAVEQVRESGPEVVTVGAPATTTSEEVADLAAEQAIAPDDWWALVDEWSASQPDRQAALIELLGDLSDRSALLATALLPPPDELANDLEAVMRRLATAHRPDEVLGAVALTWLVRGDHLDEGRVPPDDLLTSSFTMLALLAAEDPESVPEAMGTERQRQDHVDVVREAARRMPPHVEALLAAVDRHHPDPAVAKAARKELIRVRSRLAERGKG